MRSEHEQEDRGMSLYAWVDGDRASFTPNCLAEGQRVEISCPVWWRLRTDPLAGVVLENVFGQRLSADLVYEYARTYHTYGFRLRTAIRPSGQQCHSHTDGDCDWAECPQLRDWEPIRSGRTCPLYDWTDKPA